MEIKNILANVSDEKKDALLKNFAYHLLMNGIEPYEMTVDTSKEVRKFVTEFFFKDKLIDLVSDDPYKCVNLACDSGRSLNNEQKIRLMQYASVDRENTIYMIKIMCSSINTISLQSALFKIVKGDKELEEMFIKKLVEFAEFCRIRDISSHVKKLKINKEDKKMLIEKAVLAKLS